MSVTTTQTTETWQLTKVECPNCARACQMALTELKEVKAADLNYAAARLTVVFEAGIDEEQAHMAVLKVVRQSHQDLELNAIQRKALHLDQDQTPRWMCLGQAIARWLDHILLAISALCIAAGLVAPNDYGDIAFIAGALVGLGSIVPSALSAVRRLRIDMNVLMCIAVIGALILGAYEEAAIVIFLNQIGELLESYSMVKTRNSIKSLMSLAPDVAHVRCNNEWMDQALSSLELGTTIQVRAGERVPIDARIESGSSAVDESIITGESHPVDKTEGDLIYAGSLNTSGVLIATTVAREEDSTVKRIVKLVQQAQAQKAPYEEFVNRFAAVYTPVVMVAALVVALVPPMCTTFAIADLGSWSTWAYRALTLLVISCPCALVISTPVSFVSALTRAAKDGVLVKGGALFDVATRLTAIAFDKTGTLTQGRPQVVEVRPMQQGVDKQKLLCWMASVESQSNHPLARAICEAHASCDRCAALSKPTDVTEVSGAGIQASLEGIPIMVGKPAYVLHELERMGQLSFEECAQIKKVCKSSKSQAATAVMVAYNGVVQGVVYIADELRAYATDALKKLKDMRQFSKLEMLTGDNEQTAAYISNLAGLSSYQAELLPSDKIERVRNLQKDYGAAAFVGDGINDAPALAQADLGITMGAASSDTALEVADIALLHEDLRQIPRFICLAHRTMNVVRENIAAALVVKAIFFVMAIAGCATMWMAIFADTGIALLVILNGMRLMLPSRVRF